MLKTKVKMFKDHTEKTKTEIKKIVNKQAKNNKQNHKSKSQSLDDQLMCFVLVEYLSKTMF